MDGNNKLYFYFNFVLSVKLLTIIQVMEKNPHKLQNVMKAENSFGIRMSLFRRHLLDRGFIVCGQK